MTMRDYEIFCTLCEEQSFSLAAEKLGITQPTVSNTIREMEVLAHGELLHRSRTGCYPTEKGRELYELAKTIISMDRRAEKRLINTEKTNTIYGGFYTTFGEGPLASMLSKLKNSNMNGICPIIGNYRELFSQIKTGQIDFAITDYYMKDAHVRAIPLMREPMTLVASDCFNCGESISLDELASLPLIVREPGSGDYNTLETSLRINHLCFRPWAIASSNAAMLSLVRNGLGVACCSRITFLRDIDPAGLREVPLQRLLLFKKGYILLNQHRKVKRSQRKALLAIHQYLSELNAEGGLEVFPWDEKGIQGGD